MAINVYCGLQGSGKSFEVVSSVILEAVMQGRRVVTNVAGIHEDRIHEYLVNKRDADPQKLGDIVHVANDRISQPCFFPDEEKPDLQAIIKGGDLVAVDEAWRFWGTDCGKLSHEHMQFFRMHRHYVHPETAVCCDVVLMTQDVTGLHRSVKNVVEFTFRMHKHKSLGFSSAYRVEIYEGWKCNGKTQIDRRQKTYDKEIFPLYQSYTGGQGSETTIDKRQNIFANKTLWAYAGGFACLALISGVSVWKFFHPATAKNDASASASTAVVASGPASTAKPVHDKSIQPFSDVWRIAGSYVVGNERWIVLSDGAGRLRLESPSVLLSGGAAAIGEIDGERVTTWSGTSSKSSPQVAPALSGVSK